MQLWQENQLDDGDVKYAYYNTSIAVCNTITNGTTSSKKVNSLSTTQAWHVKCLGNRTVAFIKQHRILGKPSTLKEGLCFCYEY